MGSASVAVSLWPPGAVSGAALQAVLTVVGRVEISRPYYLCSHCYQGQFPADGELEVKGEEVSPGVRRMLAVVGAAAPFDHGGKQMEILAGLQVTTKAVERTAEVIGGDIARGEQQEMDRAGSEIGRWRWANPFPSCRGQGMRRE